MKISPSSEQGSLMLELMLVCFLVALIMPFLVTQLANMREQHLLSLTYLEQEKVEAAIQVEFGAQWQRLIPSGCGRDQALTLTIQAAEAAQEKLTNRSLIAGTDWLKATDFGACRVILSDIQEPIKVALNCPWQIGDNAGVSTCSGRYPAKVIGVGEESTLSFSESDLIGQAGVVESENGFYWYLAQGKSGTGALWRIAQTRGNALELWAGIERLSIFPLLDDSGDTWVDSLDTRYGDYPLEQVKALWIEYQYRLQNCKFASQTQKEQSYFSMRGQVWRYHAPCQAVANHIFVLRGNGL